MHQINGRNTWLLQISNIQLYKIDRTLLIKQPWIQIHAQKTCHLKNTYWCLLSRSKLSKQNVTLLSESVVFDWFSDLWLMIKALIIENLWNLSFMFGEASELKKNIVTLFMSRLSCKSTQILCINEYGFPVTKISVVSR